MMLQALVAYADREGLGDPDFQKRPVDYELRIRPDGAFVALIPLGEPKRRAQLSGLPAAPLSRNNPGFPSFIVDNAQYVLGVRKEKSKAGNAERCFESYAALISDAAKQTNDVALLALEQFVADARQRARADEELARLEGKKADARADRVLVPALDTDGARRVHEREIVAAWWRDRRNAERNASPSQPLARCLATGAFAPAALIHPFIKGPPFPGQGAKLVAYDKAAFSSHGLEQGANAPVSELAATKYAEALNALLERRDGRRQSAIDLDRDSVIVFWTRDESEDTRTLLLDVLAPPLHGSDAARIAENVWRGVESRAFDPTPFYAVTLGVYVTRVVVRDWFETTAREIKDNVATWFSDLKLGPGELTPMPLRSLLASLEATPSANDRHGLPPGLAGQVFRAAVHGDPLPRALLAFAVRRMRLAPHKRENVGFILRARVGIIKAALRRQRPSPMEVSVSLDESNVSVAYLLGRLFAAIERLQAAAAGKERDLNATIRDRYYGSASVTPAAVFGRLLGLSMHHASKAKDSGLGVIAERAKAQIMSKLPALGAFPNTLSLEEQGLFAVGYYHQREAFFVKRDAGGRAAMSEGGHND